MIKHPLVRYHGAKWRLAHWIISHFPKHRIYVEPFGGGGSVLLRKNRSDVEVYNDLDGEIVNLFRVVRDHGEELSRLVYLTPYSRDEFIKSFELSDDPIEQARRTVIRSFQGFGSGYVSNTEGSKCARPEYGFRIGWRCRGNKPNTNWCHVSNTVMEVLDRLRGVVIENTTYQEVIKKNNTEDTLIYADPPYLLSERDRGKDYRYEFTETDHIELAKTLREAAGPVVISGYNSELYNDLYHDWIARKCVTRTAGNTKRTEVIWIKGYKYELFDEV
jgi:DNA adenine methylase